MADVFPTSSANPPDLPITEEIRPSQALSEGPTFEAIEANSITKNR